MKNGADFMSRIDCHNDHIKYTFAIPSNCMSANNESSSLVDANFKKNAAFAPVASIWIIMMDTENIR